MSEECKETVGKRKIDFSIEGILREPYLSKLPRDDYSAEEQIDLQEREEDFSCSEMDDSKADRSEDAKNYSWLYCSRFKPPKLPRSKKRSTRKRYGRGPRIPFAAHQIAVLENAFSKSHYLSPDCIARLADSLLLNETRVKIWFQNRRARYRREQELLSLTGNETEKRVDSGTNSPVTSVKTKLSKSPKKDVDSKPNSDLSDYEQHITVIESPESYRIPLPIYPSNNELHPGQVFKYDNPNEFTAERFNASYYNRLLLGGSCSAFVPLFRR